MIQFVPLPLCVSLELVICRGSEHVIKWSTFLVIFILLCRYPSVVSASQDQVSQKIAQCDKQLDNIGAVSTCSTLVGTNWNCVNYVHSSIESPITPDHQHQLAMMCGESGPLFCCPIWAMIRCLLQLVKDNCSTMGGSDFLIHYRTRTFESGIEQLQASSCVNFTFNSIECENVFTYVKDIRLLERVAEKHGLLKYFFSSHIGSNISKLIEFNTSLALTRGKSGSNVPFGHLSWLAIVVAIFVCMCHLIF